MADSFADLWNSTAPSTAQPQVQKKLGSIPPKYQQPKPKHDAFALLASSSSRSHSNPNSASTSRSITPASIPAHQKSGRGDAFGDLLSLTGINANANANMTIAERQRVLQQQASSSKSTVNTSGVKDNMGQWTGLDSLAAAASTKPGTTAVLVNDDDDWGLGDFSSAPPPLASTSTPAPPATKSLWDLENLASPAAAPQRSNVSQPSSHRSTPQGSKPTQPAVGKSLWDLDEFASPSSSSSPALQPSSTHSKAKSKTVETTFNSPENDFDFGSREDQDFEELGSHIPKGQHYEEQDEAWSDVPNRNHAREQDGEEDDILGLLSKPVDEVVTKQVPTTLRASTSIQPSRSSIPTQPHPRSASPPPHVLGQLIEMGFSIPQAKAALAQTPGGLDVQMALETLLNGGGDSESDGHQQEDRFSHQVQEHSRNQQQDRSRNQQQDHPRNQHGSRTPQQQQQPANIQDQADKLLAQASEIGMSVLSKASLFWKEGRKAVVDNVQKVVVENVIAGDEGRGQANGRGKGRGQMNGRPKWMQEGGAEEEEEEQRDRGGFKDDLSPVDEVPNTRGRDQPPPRTDQPPPRREEEAVVDLFAPAPVAQAEPRTTPYVSPWRRGKPTPSPASSPAPVQTPKPAPAHPSIPLPTLHQVRAHKTRGTELFKLGQFSGACEAYSAAIALLPERHLLLVPLYTNRALGRLRVGDYAGAIEDCAGALGIVGGPPFVSDGAGQSGGGWDDPCGRGVDLADGWVKALKRRAEAWEGREKWDEARRDWEVLLGASGGVGQGVRGEAGRGVERCRRMIGGGENGTNPKPKSQTKPRPKPKPVSMRMNKSQEPSQALQSLRASSQALESEEELKASLKDSVDARLMAWKGGKETNIRALLASLDTVLWDDVVKDMGGKVALSELVLEGQVKKKYMRAVGRVHPDKLNSGNSTVEQRMLANGVFGALNEAWNAFK